MQDGQRVVLCGVSGVLVQHDQPFREAVIRSSAAALGIAAAEVEYQDGGSDPETLRRTLLASGARTAELPSLLERAAALLREHLRDGREAIAAASRTPGSAELLTQLKHRQQAPISALTGHTRDNAATLLAAIGLDRYLDLGLGGYGDEASDRSELLSIAQAKVAAGCGAEQAGRIVVLTDVAADLTAAAALGLRTVGVASGPAAAELAAAGAERVLPGLADVPAALAAILD